MSSRLITIMMIYTSQIVIYNKTMFMWVSHIIYIYRRTHITSKLINVIYFKNYGIYFFCLKRNSDGSTLYYTTRLVAKGFHQRSGIDYKDQFSLVVKQNGVMHFYFFSMKLLMKKYICLNHLFLCIKYTYSNYICMLQKSLYGLNEAPNAYTNIYVAIKTILIVAYFVVYVDDLLFNGNTFNFHLGVELLPISKCIFLSQWHYIQDILQKGNMIDAKLVCTPIPPTSNSSTIL